MYRVSYHRSGRHKSKGRYRFLVPYTIILTQSVDNGQFKDPARLRDAAVGVEPDCHVVWGECFLSFAMGSVPRLQEGALAVIHGDPVVLAVACALYVESFDGQANQRTYKYQQISALVKLSTAQVLHLDPLSEPKYQALPLT